jgi:hypothetical protein
MADNLTKAEIKQYIKSEIDKAIEDKIKSAVKKELSTKATQEDLTDLYIKIMVKFYRDMSNRSSFWSKNLK